MELVSGSRSWAISLRMGQTLHSFLNEVYIPSRLDLSDKSADQCRIAVRLLDRWNGHPVTLKQLSASLILKWLKSMAEAGRASATVNAKRGLILTIWRFAAKKRLAPKVPDLDELPKKRETKRLPEAWSVEEMNRLLEVCSSLTGQCRCNGIDRRKFWSTLILFCYETGCRLTAALSVRVSELDLVNGTVLLRCEAAKTKIEQRHRLSPYLIERLKEHLTDRELIWPWSQCHRRLWPYLKKILKLAGLSHDRRSLFHKIRRTTATWSAVHGSVDLARQTLGHTSEKMTIERYIDPRYFRPQEAIDVLPKLG